MEWPPVTRSPHLQAPALKPEPRLPPGCPGQRVSVVRIMPSVATLTPQGTLPMDSPCSEPPARLAEISEPHRGLTLFPRKPSSFLSHFTGVRPPAQSGRPLHPSLTLLLYLSLGFPATWISCMSGHQNEVRVLRTLV